MTKADKILKEEIADEIKVQKLFAELANVIDEKHSIELAIELLVNQPKDVVITEVADEEPEIAEE